MLARLARAQVGLGLECMIVEHERDYRGTRLEWPAVASVSHYTLTALALTNTVIDCITVRTSDMESTARELADLACTEALTFLLGQRVGQARAFSLVHALSQDALDRKKAVRDCALANHELSLVLDRETIEEIFDPSSYLGSAGELVDGVLARRSRLCRGRPGAVDVPACKETVKKTNFGAGPAACRRWRSSVRGGISSTSKAPASRSSRSAPLSAYERVRPPRSRCCAS